jgi:hypothetical protein
VVRAHLKIIAIAVLFGLGAYAVVLVLIRASRMLGVLDWLS